MKPRGRPRIAPNDRSVDVHFRMGAKQYDLSQKQADQARITLADWLRRAVARACRPKV